MRVGAGRVGGANGAERSEREGRRGRGAVLLNRLRATAAQPHREQDSPPERRRPTRNRRQTSEPGNKSSTSSHRAAHQPPEPALLAVPRRGGLELRGEVAQRAVLAVAALRRAKRVWNRAMREVCLMCCDYRQCRREND